MLLPTHSVVYLTSRRRVLISALQTFYRQPASCLRSTRLRHQSTSRRLSSSTLVSLDPLSLLLSVLVSRKQQHSPASPEFRSLRSSSRLPEHQDSKPSFGSRENKQSGPMGL